MLIYRLNIYEITAVFFLPVIDPLICKRWILVPLTQLSSCDREVPIQNDPLLNTLSVGGCILVDPVNSFLDGGVDRPVSSACDLRDFCGVAAQLPADLDSFCCQLILGFPWLCVYLTLEGTHFILLVWVSSHVLSNNTCIIWSWGLSSCCCSFTTRWQHPASSLLLLLSAKTDIMTPEIR